MSALFVVLDLELMILDGCIGGRSEGKVYSHRTGVL